MITAPTRAATGRDAAAWRATDLERDTARWTQRFDDAARPALFRLSSNTTRR
jgi:hypothetical protein